MDVVPLNEEEFNFFVKCSFVNPEGEYINGKVKRSGL
jgi:hypothetical protein